MTRARRHSPAFAWLLLAAVLALRAFVPAGWMPVSDADGVRIAVCSDGVAQVMVLGQDGKLRHEGPQAPRDPCPFGTAAAPALDLPAVPLAVVAALLPEAPPAPPQPAARPRPAPHAPRPPSQGPPLLA